MNINLTNIRINDEKEKIIKMYESDIRILDIAKKYGVVERSMYRYLKKWGISIKRKPYQSRRKKVKKFKREFSPELLAKMKENTRINNKKIKFFETIDTAKDKFLVWDMLRKSEVIK